MAAKKGGLGKGLDSLLVNKVNKTEATEKPAAASTTTATKKRSTKKETPDSMVKISLVEPNREQPRKHFDEDGLLELAESIKQYGILQALLVQEKNGYYEIIAGERRWRAAKLAGLKEVPVIIRKLSNQQIVEISLIENIQREDLNPIEEAQAYRRLMEEFHLKQDEIAERVSKSRKAVTNSMRLLKLSKQVMHFVYDAPDGIIMRSHFWIGFQAMGGKLVKVVGNRPMPEEDMLLGLLEHNSKEMNNLRDLMPILYTEFRDK